MMNYITEINRFYDWLETNQVPKSAIALWHSLMHIANKSGWEQRFTVAISTIESKTGFKRSELNEARNILTQKGRILWRSRGGNLCAEYEIIPFCDHIADAKAITKAYTSADTIPTTNPTQTVPINKLNKTELFILISKAEKNLVYLQELFSQDEGLKMRWSHHGLPAEKFPHGVELWLQRQHGKTYHDFQKARDHFFNWIQYYHSESEKHEKLKQNGFKKNHRSVGSAGGQLASTAVIEPGKGFNTVL